MLQTCIQALIVAALVLLAAAHAGWLLLPEVWRQPLALRLTAHLRTRGDSFWQRTLLRIVRAPSASCGDCGGRARCPTQKSANALPYDPQALRPGTIPARLIVSSRTLI